MNVSPFKSLFTKSPEELNKQLNIALKKHEKEPDNIEDNAIVIRTQGPIIGTSIHTSIDRLIYVQPAAYGDLSEKERYAVADLVGKIANIDKRASKTIMLLGPGRWGTTTPSLGVPVKLSDINNVSVLCEIAEMHDGLVPDVSLGTHFFNDLVESDIFYIALFPQKQDVIFNDKFLSEMQNLLTDFVPEAEKFKDVIKVYENSEKN